MSQQALVTTEEPTEVNGLIAEMAEESLLLPMSSVAEVVREIQVQSAENLPHWMYGWLDWRYQKVPLISYEALLGGEKPILPDRTQAVILNVLGDSGTLPFYALYTQSLPRFVTVSKEDGLQALASANAEPEVADVLMRVRLGEQELAITNLEAVEQKCRQGVEGAPR